ncbi:unnamed protein product, partial [Bubo scandiacus]
KLMYQKIFQTCYNIFLVSKANSANWMIFILDLNNCILFLPNVVAKRSQRTLSLEISLTTHPSRVFLIGLLFFHRKTSHKSPTSSIHPRWSSLVLGRLHPTAGSTPCWSSLGRAAAPGKDSHWRKFVE